MTTPALPRRLYRSRTDRMLGGVAGGLAAYLEIDPVLMRLAFAALLFAGVGFPAYIVAWIVIPEEPPAGTPLPTTAEPARTPAPTPPPRSGSAAGRGARLVVGTILVAIGTLLLLDWALPDLHRFFWPTAFIALGLGLLAYGARR
jgi:phage shock protein C